ncbi:MAG: 3D domain-containing protein [Patescibacteria group bacterium]|nr:3D domain-containing protein [Patescibacteria group bacterium]
MLATTFSLPAKAAETKYMEAPTIEAAITTTISLDSVTKDLSVLKTNNPEDKKTIETNTIKSKKRTIVSTAVRDISAYNVGDVNQCDGNPCIAANGENVCDALNKGYKRCAANFVPFGTILEIEGYGECIVTDRMASRFGNSVDIAFKYEDKEAALHWGRRSLEVNIVKYTQE